MAQKYAGKYEVKTFARLILNNRPDHQQKPSQEHFLVLRWILAPDPRRLQTLAVSPFLLSPEPHHFSVIVAVIPT